MPTHSAQSSPQESMMTPPEMTLSALAWPVAFAMTYGLFPTVLEIPSVGSGNFPLGKVKVHRRQAEGKRIFSPGAAQKYPGAQSTSMPQPQCLLPSNSPVSHQHANISSAMQQCTCTSSVPNTVVDLVSFGCQKAAIVYTLKFAIIGFFLSHPLSFKTGHYGDTHWKSPPYNLRHENPPTSSEFISSLG
ncbi:hypothetical protein EDB86DRAFT_3107881 [Lactarius hatsudake]|nr:hypothetical protein EDB86DRAFT_3107881 [Lactarius hatsudake]